MNSSSKAPSVVTGLKVRTDEQVYTVRLRPDERRAIAVGEMLGHLLLRIDRGLRKLTEAVVARYERQRAYDELMAFDDRTLADIGITRADIPAVVAGTYAGATIGRRGNTQYFPSLGHRAPANESHHPQAA